MSTEKKGFFKGLVDKFSGNANPSELPAESTPVVAQQEATPKFFRTSQKRPQQNA